MFGIKKKDVPVTETPTAKPEVAGPSIRNCINCGARCSRNNSSIFHCVFCGSDFTDEEAERIAQRKAAAIEAAIRQANSNK